MSQEVEKKLYRYIKEANCIQEAKLFCIFDCSAFCVEEKIICGQHILEPNEKHITLQNINNHSPFQNVYSSLEALQLVDMDGLVSPKIPKGQNSAKYPVKSRESKSRLYHSLTIKI